MNKRRHNQARGHNRLRNTFVIGLLGLVGTAAVIGGIKYEDGKAKEAAAISRELEVIIDPEIDQLGSQALDEYQAQPDKDEGNIHLSVDAKEGTATLTGSAEKQLVIDGKVLNTTDYSMLVVMGLDHGTPDPTHTIYARFVKGSSSSDGKTAQLVQFTAPGSGEYRTYMLPGDRSDGWSAASGGATEIGGGGVHGHETSTDKRSAWMGNPDPLPPTQSANLVIDDAEALVPDVLAGLSA